MASISPAKTRGTIARKILFRMDGKQRKIGVGVCSRQFANEILTIVSALEIAIKNDRLPEQRTVDAVNAQPQWLQQRLATAGLLATADGATATTMTPQMLVDWFMASERGRWKSDHVADVKRSNLKSFVNFCDQNGIDDVSRVRKNHLEQYKSHLVKTLAKSTAQVKARSLKDMFGTAYKHGKIRHNPAAEFDTYTGKTKTELPDVGTDQAIEIAAATNDDDLALCVMLARFASCRAPSEVMPMTWSDVDLWQGWIRIRNEKTIDSNEPYRRFPVYPQLDKHLKNLYQIRFGKTYPGFDEKDKRGVPIGWEKPERWWSDTHLIETPRYRKDPRHLWLFFNRCGVWKRLSESLYGTPDKSDKVKVRSIFRACRRACVNDVITSNPPLAVAAVWCGHTIEVMAKEYARVQSRHLHDWDVTTHKNPFTPDRYR